MGGAPSIGAVISDANGVKWKRVAVNPQASFDTKMDPYSAKSFAKVTNKKGIIGDLWDRSADARLAREAKEGEGNDPIQKQFFSDYSKRRKGRKHPDQVRGEQTRALKKQGIKIDWGED